MKTITKRNQCPTDFNLKNYDEIINFTPEHWRENLHELWSVWYSLTNGYKDDIQIGFGVDNFKIDTKKISFFDNKKEYTNTELTEIINTKSIGLLSIYESLEIRNTIEYSNALKNMIFYPQNSDIDANQALELYEERSLFNGESIAVTLNILASDEQLINDLKSFITSYRRALKITPPSSLIIPNEKNIRNWTRWRIIQYLDLHIWELMNEVKISYPLLGEMLFPEEHELDTGERVRNTIKPNAMKLMTAINDYYDQLSDSEDRSSLTKDQLTVRGYYARKEPQER